MKPYEKMYGIEMERFVGAVVIIGHHILHFHETAYFWGGWIFVEFFFILTGYFSVAHFERGGVKSFSEKDIMFYVLRKAKRFFPYICVSVALSFIYRDFVSNDFGAREIFYDVIKLPLYCCGLVKTGIAADAFSMQLWYISEIILFLPAILLLVVKKNSLFKYFFAWFLPVMIYAGLMSSLGHIAYWDDVFLSNLSCALRGIAGMCIGACVYYICEYRKKAGRALKARCMGYMADKVCFALFVLTACFANVDEMSVVPVLAAAAAVGAAVCKGGRPVPPWLERLCMHMGKLSLPVYCLHYQVMQYIHDLWCFGSWKRELLVDLPVVLLLSEICMNITDRFCKDKKFG